MICRICAEPNGVVDGLCQECRAYKAVIQEMTDEETATRIFEEDAAKVLKGKS
jgi:hypothetical protein